MDGFVARDCVHAQDLLWLGHLGVLEDLVVRCWCWLDGELAVWNISEDPFPVYVNVMNGASLF